MLDGDEDEAPEDEEDEDNIEKDAMIKVQVIQILWYIVLLALYSMLKESIF
jgi:hypothetical protein